MTWSLLRTNIPSPKSVLKINSTSLLSSSFFLLLVAPPTSLPIFLPQQAAFASSHLTSSLIVSTQKQELPFLSTMGASSSTDSKNNQASQQQLQRDIQYLGDRMPFGDEELLLVYRTYQRLIDESNFSVLSEQIIIDDNEEQQPLPSQQQQLGRISFLTDMAVLALKEQQQQDQRRLQPKNQQSIRTESHSDDKNIAKNKSSAAQEEEMQERRILLEAVERKILPPQFGNTLYRNCFLRSSDQSEYDTNTNKIIVEDGVDSNATATVTTTTMTAPPGVDEYTRMARLEKFFEGLSDGTRRGSKAAVLSMIKCCQHYEDPISGQSLSNNGNNGVTSSSSTSNDFVDNNNSSNTYGSSCSGGNTGKKFIQPLEFVTLGYRIGLAAAFLKATTTPKIKTNNDVGGGEEAEDDDDDDDDDTDVSQFIPPSSAFTEIPPGLQALANSLAELALKRQQRITRSSTPYTQVDLSQQLVDEDDILEWAEQVGPMYGSILPTFLHLIFFPNKPVPHSRTSFEYPQLSQESAVFKYGYSPLLFSFGCMSSSLGGEYFRLYTSASDGLSFNRLQNALLGYGGPTLLIIQSGSCTFGAFTASPWKESKDFYGNHDCFLYRLLPDAIAVYRPTGQSSNFMYCNSLARSRGYDRQAHGIGFGGTVDQPRLFLAESFDNCQAGRDDLTFEKGSLLGSGIGGGVAAAGGGGSYATTFEIDNLEVWAVGGTEVVQESLQARSRSRDVRQAAIQKARKVDKAAFLDDFQSGLIESKAFAHRQQVQGREGACVDDEKEKYHYEK